MSIFDNDRPLDYDEEKDGEPRIRPEPLGEPEKLAVDAHDVEEFIEHYGQDDEPLQGEQGAP